MNSKYTQISIYLGTFFVLTGLSYAIFSFLIPNIQKPNPLVAVPTTIPSKTGILQYEGPKTEMCPLNGQMHTKAEQAIWSTRRPLLVMIENHADSRPQSGLQNADIVYELVAEGGITRFMAIYYCGVLQGSPNKYDIGPVRSARSYFLDLASEYADYPLYAHVGGANCSAATPGGPCTSHKKALALEQIGQYGWTNKGTWSDLNEFSLSYRVCRREPDRTGTTKNTEHSMYCSTTALWDIASTRGLTNITQINNTKWDKNFRPWTASLVDKKATDGPVSVGFDFWTGYKAYSVKWVYDSNNNNYLRYNGGQPHVDFDTGDTITTKNFIIQFVKETRSVDEHLHNLYDVIGSGKGVLVQNGAPALDITWSKVNRLSRTIYKDKSGQEVNFVPGPIWIEILPIGNTINYENQQ